MNEQIIYIYEIYCKDCNVKDNYIGQTECIEQRLNQHMNLSKTSDFKLYRCIRDNGGWENWEMKILDEQLCQTEYETRQLEQQYIDYHKPTLNSISKNKNKTEIHICEYCNSYFENKYSLKKHKNSNKKCLEIQSKKLIDNNDIQFFICEFCKKEFTSNYYLNHHLLSSNACKIIAEKDNEIQKLLSKIEHFESMNKNSYEYSTNENLQKQIDDIQKNIKEIFKILK